MDTDSTPPVFVPETLVHGADRKTERQDYGGDSTWLSCGACLPCSAGGGGGERTQRVSGESGEGGSPRSCALRGEQNNPTNPSNLTPALNC